MPAELAVDRQVQCGRPGPAINPPSERRRERRPEELYAASSRVAWAVLLRRTYGVDALRCPTCAARMRVMATLVEPSVVTKILAHLGLPTEALPRARARDPTGQESFDGGAA
jgi:hypothetical protein